MQTRKPSKSFRDLLVWQKAHALVLAIHKQSTQYPKEEIYGLTSQIRRSATSVAASIAEAFKKRSAADEIRIMNITQASLSETKYYLILIRDLDYANTKALEEQADEVGKILESYISSIRSKNVKVLNPNS